VVTTTPDVPSPVGLGAKLTTPPARPGPAP
jgi:hypothetical protein